jgi:hypothetical protein
MRGFGATGHPVRRHHRAASFDEWHFTSPDLRGSRHTAAALAGDIRTVARNFALCIPGTGSAVLRISVSFLRPDQRSVNAVFLQHPAVLRTYEKTGA